MTTGLNDRLKLLSGQGVGGRGQMMCLCIRGKKTVNRETPFTFEMSYAEWVATDIL